MRGCLLNGRARSVVSLALTACNAACSENGFGDAELDWTDPVPASQEHAALAIIRLANQFPGELVLVTVGPLTNLAIACSLDPTLPSKVKSLTWMGGSPYGNGNSTPVAGT